MEEQSIVKRLMKVDKELHLLIEELKSKSEPKMSLDELRELFNSQVISDEDPTELIRKMRDKEYGL